MNGKVKTLLEIDKDVKEVLSNLKATQSVNPASYMREAIREKLEADGHLPIEEYKQFTVWFRNPRSIDNQLQSEKVRAKNEAEVRDIYESLELEVISIELYGTPKLSEKSAPVSAAD